MKKQCHMDVIHLGQKLTYEAKYIRADNYSLF